MKSLINEVRLYIAELLLGWAADAAPENDEGDLVRITVYEHFTNLKELK